MEMLALFSLIRGCSMTGTGSSTNHDASFFGDSRFVWNRRRRRRAFTISGIAWDTPATGTFGTDYYESISEDENGGPFVGRLICDKIVGGLTTGWKLRKDASRTREVWSRGTNCHGKKKTDERGEEKEGGHGDNETSTVQLGPKCDAVAIVCSRDDTFYFPFL